MAEITAAAVKELRDRSGAGMMDCKKALTEANGDLEAATDWLRAKGLAAAQKKSSRTAAEGLVGVATELRGAAVVEINAETDFVARNDLFQAFATRVAAVALENNGDLAAIQAAALPNGSTVANEMQELVATIGENMNLRRAAMLEAERTSRPTATDATMAARGVALRSARPMSVCHCPSSERRSGL